MLGILAPNKLFLNSISVFTVYTELETLPKEILRSLFLLSFDMGCYYHRLLIKVLFLMKSL